MVESLLIALIVFCAIVYAVWALTPGGTRSRLALRAAAALATRGGAGAWLAARLRSIARVPAGGCGSCPSHTETPAERASRTGSNS
jgi:hypothetical protein